MRSEPRPRNPGPNGAAAPAPKATLPRDSSSNGEGSSNGERRKGEGLLGGVLLIEDDPELQWRLARHLTLLGYRVVGTSSSDAGLELMMHWPARFVLVSATPIGTEGAELARKIRVRHPEARIVLLVDAANGAEDRSLADAVHQRGDDLDTLRRLMRSLHSRASIPPLDNEACEGAQ